MLEIAAHFYLNIKIYFAQTVFKLRFKAKTPSLSGSNWCVHRFHQGPDGFEEAGDDEGVSESSRRSRDGGGLLFAPGRHQHPPHQLQ